MKHQCFKINLIIGFLLKLSGATFRFQIPLAGSLLIAFLLSLSPSGLMGQCDNRITAAAGSSQQFGCTTVEVSADGDYEYIYSCDDNNGPYVNRDGKTTFTFSNPVHRVIIRIMALEHHVNPFHLEETTLEINGVPTPFPNAGFPTDCPPLPMVPVILTPWGSLQSPLCAWGCHAGCENLVIDATINSISLINTTIANAPTGHQFSISFCTISAGTLNATPLSFCIDAIAVLPPTIGAYLDPGTLLQYVLCSDPNDLPGSIVATSNTPSFAFNPATMQTNTPYYAAAIAGDDLNGNVDLNGCLMFSNTIEVTWRDIPTVSFSIENTDICVGGCATVTLQFTGEPPFTLTYESGTSGQITEIFQEPASTFIFCPPFNAPAGPLQIQAISLIDANCACN